MPVHPEARKILDLVDKAGRPEYWELTPAQAKANHEKAFPVLDIEPVELDRIENFQLDVAGGRIPLRVYWPNAVSQESRPGEGATGEPHGAMLWIHGGGHVVGSIECYDAVCRRLVAQSGHVICSVGYRLAPEYKFPVAVDDAYAALQWLAQQAGTLGVDPGRLMVGGDSAGGNLAAVTVVEAREGGGPILRHQLLIYPVTAPRPNTQSHEDYGVGHLLTRKNIDWFQNHYARDEADRDDPRFAPLRRQDLSGLPSATVVVAECDPLHDEGLAYADKLRAAGVDVEVMDYEGMLHGFMNMGGWLEDSRRLLDECARVMRASLAT